MNDNYDPDLITNYERDTWARCAEKYIDTFAGLTGKAVPELIKIGNIGPDSHVLEIGSGPGNAAKELADVCASVKGIDFSDKMVEVANLSWFKFLKKQMKNRPRLVL